MIELECGYGIKADSMGYTLVTALITKKGLTEKVEGYYPTLDMALNGYAEALIRDEIHYSDFTLKEAISMIREVRDDIMKLGGAHDKV